MGKTIERNYHIKEYLIKQPDEKTERDYPFRIKTESQGVHYTVAINRNYSCEP